MVGSKCFGGDVRFVVAGSGHIAGVINPPAKHKYQYWTGPKPRNADIAGWLAKAKEHAGLVVAGLAAVDHPAEPDRGPGARFRARVR